MIWDLRLDLLCAAQPTNSFPSTATALCSCLVASIETSVGREAIIEGTRARERERADSELVGKRSYTCLRAILTCETNAACSFTYSSIDFHH